MASVPLIYAPRVTVSPLSLTYRAFAGAIAIACAGVLGFAAFLTPSPTGVGTHSGLGLAKCEFLYRTGLPCPSCGMTTSFAHFTHGNLLASFYVQPMGTILAVLTAVGFWVALYIALTGKPALRLLRIVPAGYYVLPLMFTAVAAWGWKIFIHVQGIDGWGT